MSTKKDKIEMLAAAIKSGVNDELLEQVAEEYEKVNNLREAIDDYYAVAEKLINATAVVEEATEAESSLQEFLELKETADTIENISLDINSTLRAYLGIEV